LSTTSPGKSKRVAVSLLAGALGVFGIALATPAGATADVNTEDRAAGATRFGTAADVADTAYPDGNDTVIIANGRKFPDALAASGLAGALDAPILLTELDSVPTETSAGIEALGATNAVIVGGTAAVNDDVQSALEDDGLTVTRIAGEDRYETAGEVAAEIGDYDRAIVASGEVAADALSAGPIAADTPAPILLVQKDNVPDATAAALDGVGEVILVGGTARISDATAAEVEGDSADTDAERVAGVDRQNTAEQVATWEVDNLGWAPDTVLIAAPRSPSDDFSPDALVAGPLGAILDAPILITGDCATLGDAAEGFLTAHADTIATIIPVGGTAVICDSLVEDAAAAAGDEGEPTDNTDFSLDPSDDQSTFLDDADPAASAISFTVDIGDNETVAIALVPCEDVDVSDAGVVTLLDDDENNEADSTGDVDNAFIDTVNGVNVDDDTVVEDVEPNSSGNVSFTVNSDGPDCVRAVVWADDGDGDIDLDENGAPTEEFGISGELNFLPQEASGEQNGSSFLVVDVDKDENFFVGDEDFDVTTTGDQFTFFYDGSDDFNVRQEDNPLTPADEFDDHASTVDEFEGELSKFDEITVLTYADNPDLDSDYDMYDNGAEAPDVTLTQDENDITLEVIPQDDNLSDDDTFDTMDAGDLVVAFKAEVDPEQEGDIAVDPTGDECSDIDFVNAINQGDLTADDFDIVGAMTKADEEAAVDGDFDGVFTFELPDEPESDCEIYGAALIVDGDLGDPGFDANTGNDQDLDGGAFGFPDPVVIGGADDTGDPTIESAVVDETNGTLDTVADDGDVIDLLFSEEMESNFNARFIVTDADGDRFQIDCSGGGVECDLLSSDPDDADNLESADNGDLLRIEFQGGMDGVTDLNPGTGGDDVLNYPATIQSTTNIEDTSGNGVNVTDSPDKVIDEGTLDDDTGDGNAV
jgi:putative cell wall-binding protein